MSFQFTPARPRVFEGQALCPGAAMGAALFPSSCCPSPLAGGEPPGGLLVQDHVPAWLEVVRVRKSAGGSGCGPAGPEKRGPWLLGSPAPEGLCLQASSVQQGPTGPPTAPLCTQPGPPIAPFSETGSQRTAHRLKGKGLEVPGRGLGRPRWREARGRPCSRPVSPEWAESRESVG